MDELQIYVQTILDQVESLKSIEASLEAIGKQVTIPVSAELDIPKSLQQIRRGIESLEKLHVDLTGRLNRSESRKAIKKDLKALGNEQVAVKVKVDKAELKKSLKEAGAKATTIDVGTNVEGTEDLEKVSDGLDGINKKSAATVASITLLNQALIELEQAAKKMIQTSAQLDEKLTDLRMVTGDSYEEASELVANYNDLAKSLGATTKDVLDASSDWLRQGHAVSETNELIRNSMILSKVSNLEAAASTEFLTSSMKGYRVAVEDVIGIVDKLTAVDLVSAVDAGGLAEAMSQTAVSANLAGVEMDRLIGYLAAVGEVTQDGMSSVGNAFKTFFARYSDIKAGKLELIDEDGTVEALSDVEQSLKNVGIDMRSTITAFDDYDDTLASLAAKWDDLSNIQQSAIAKAFGGTRQKERFLVLMENYDKAASYMETAANSAGTAEKKFSAYLESLGAKIESFNAAFESLSMNTFDAQFMGGLVDAATALIEFIDGINLLQAALVGLSAAGILKGFTMIANSAKNAYGDVLKLSTAFDIMGKAKGVGVTADQMRTLISVTKGLSESQLRLVVSNKALTNEQRMAILTSSGLTKEQAAQTLSTMGLATAETTATAATFSLSGAMRALGAAIMANPIGFLATALTIAVSVIHTATSAVSELRNASIQAAAEARKAALDEADAIKKAYVAYMQYTGKQDRTAEEESAFQSAVEQVTAALRDKAIVLSGLTAGTEEYTAALQKATKEELQQTLRAAKDYLTQVRGELEGLAYSYWFGGMIGFEMKADLSNATDEYIRAWNIAQDTLGEYAQHFQNNVIEKFLIAPDAYDAESVVDYYYTLLDLKNQLNDADLIDTDIYRDVQSIVDGLSQSINEYVRASYEVASHEYDLGTGLPTTIEEFLKYREYLNETLGKNIEYEGLSSVIDTFLSEESDSYAKWIAELASQALSAEEIAEKRKAIVDALVPPDSRSGTLSEYHSKSQYFANRLSGLSDVEIEIAYKAVVEEGATTWDDIVAAIERYNAEQEFAKTKAGQLQASLKSMWSSESFADTKDELIELAYTLDGITPQNIEELANESGELALLLEQDGMNAQFLANVLQLVACGKNGFALITDDALALNDALDGMVDSFDSVVTAKSRYDAAMSVNEKDMNFRSYAEAFAELNAQFEAGTTNSNAFWAAAEFLFGSEQLAEWGWGDGLDEIYQAMDANRSVFEDADSAGAGFLDRLYELSEAGELVNEQGEKLIDITKNADGSFDFSVDPENIAEIASQMNLTEEAVLACFQALSMWGNINFYNVDEVITTLEDIGLAADTTSGKAVNLSRLTEQLLTLGKTDKEIYDIISAMQGVDGITLLGVTDDVDTLIGSLTELGIVSGEGTEIEIDYTELVDVMQASGFAKEEVQALVGTLSAVDESGAEEALAYIDTLTFDNVTQNLGSISDAIGDVDDSTTDGTVSELNDVASAATNAASQVASIGDAMDSLNGREATMYYSVVRKDSVLGMFGFAKGTKNAPAGEALVGEEGVELWQSGDQARLVGVGGPEIVDLNEGDTIYTNAQTKQILSKSGKQIRGAIPAYKMGFNNRKLNSLHIKDTHYSNDGAGSGTTPPSPEPEGEVGGDGITPAPYTPPNKKESGTGGGSSGNSEDTEKSFEDQYKEHQHMRQMDQESDQDYFDWLDKAYKEAYEKGEIELEEYWKYEEEVYKGRQDLFNDSLSDREHQISMLEHEGGNEKEIISIYKGMISDVDAEIAAAKERGLDENSDYVQNLLKQRNSYEKAIVNIEDEINENAKKAAEELVDFRIEMIKQELNDEKDALNDKLSALKKFYDKQKEMLKDQYDEEKYLEEQNEKRKAKADIEAELAQLEFDDSAWAQKRKIELQEELAEADKDLEDFEKDHAYEQAQSLLDDAYEKQEELIQSQIDAIDEKLNDPNALYNQALNDIKNNTEELYQQMIDYNNQHGDGNPETVKEMWENAYVAFDNFFDLFGEFYKGIDLANATGYSKEKRSGSGYATGTRSATTGWHEIDEEGSEYIFADQGDRKYRMFSAGEKVLDADSADFLYDFAVSKGSIVDKLLDDFANAGDWIVRSIVGSSYIPEKEISRMTQSITDNRVTNIDMSGDTIIQGNADEKTVSEIRREQRAGMKYILKEFNRLNR